MEYRKIKDYDNYMVSSDGKILNIKRNKHLVNVLAERCLIVLLYKNNKRKMHYVHRLVADAFCEKKDGKNYVNHKDLNRCNNDISNLEWVSPSENRLHYIASDKYKPTILTKKQKNEIKERLYKKVICNDTLKIFKSIGHFAKYKKISLSQASIKLNNKCFNNLNARFL